MAVSANNPHPRIAGILAGFYSRPDTNAAFHYHEKMNERETYESVKRDIKTAIESIRARSPEAAEYLDKHLARFMHASTPFHNQSPSEMRR
jgi:hypothetical protein